MKPELAKITAPSERVQKLRKYYSENSAMVLDRTLAPWKCSHSRLLYAEGWAKNADAPTVVFRRSMAEKYMLENTKPVICAGELIAGQPNFAAFNKDETEKDRYYTDLLRDGAFRNHAAEPTIWRSTTQSCFLLASRA